MNRETRVAEGVATLWTTLETRELEKENKKETLEMEDGPRGAPEKGG